LTTGAAINLDIDDALTTSATKSLVSVDYDKSGNTASGQTSLTKALNIDLKDNATDNVGATTMIGVQTTIDSADADGTVTQIGYQALLSDGDTNLSIGYYSVVEDGGVDFKSISSAHAQDYFTLATGAGGATTLTTVDTSVGATAHFKVTADGSITLDSAAHINLEVVDGDYVNMYNTTNKFASFYAESTSTSSLIMYEMGGDSVNDHFTIDVAEHGATTLTTLDAAAAAAHFEIAADGNITLDSAGDIVLEAAGNDVTIDTDNIAISSSTSAKPYITLTSTHTDKDQSAEIRFVKDAADTEDGENLGSIAFYGEDEGNNQTKFAGITAEIGESAETDEAGKLTLFVAESDGSNASTKPGLVIEGNSGGGIDNTVNAIIGNASTSTTTVAGSATVTSVLTLTTTSVNNLADDGSIPITSSYVNIDANGGARTGIRFGGAGTAGQVIYVNNTGGETLTFHATVGTCLVRGLTTDLDTMEATGVYHFISDGTYWNFIGGGTFPGEGLTAS